MTSHHLPAGENHPGGPEGYTSLFDGTTLNGWYAVPRSYGTQWPGGPHVLETGSGFPADYQTHADAHPAKWTVEDGALVGRQDPPGSGYGGYLVSEEAYGDFELVLEAKPDWPADSGIMIRRRPDSWEGIQVLLDHRRSGSIGGYYGNGIGAFHAVPFALTARKDAEGNAVGLREDDPETSVEPFSSHKRDLLTRGADVTDFLSVWRWMDWNEFRIRCVGLLPRVTTWINGLLVAEIDMSTLDAPHYDPEAVAALLGPEGHIAFEVHDTDPRLGRDRWGPDAACRWRNVRVRRL
ncbi:DUF1080 domain-containing protein [Streptomyces tubbatahanensis]|uniref:DUF1080 domain-containing protein n=1 Tax=Streptomyces tubbatahanensis TaxID=2923272 RepID=A0ABY3XLP8_9ACTN|nr:DUF1080 domain-containing protein [Streptomyces tubbatahanensis]UNS95329.1 DUF1080 domain-containing protein [Streptomyces tubbatahanensis]